MFLLHLQLSVLFNAIFTTDLEFATLMVQTLNLILLTSPELFELRSSLKRVALFFV